MNYHTFQTTKYNVLSSIQMREHGVELNDKAKRHDGKQNLRVEGNEVPLNFEAGLLHLPIREPTDEDIWKCPIIIISSDEPCNIKTVDGHYLGGDSMQCH